MNIGGEITRRMDETLAWREERGVETDVGPLLHREPVLPLDHPVLQSRITHTLIDELIAERDLSLILKRRTRSLRATDQHELGQIGAMIHAIARSTESLLRSKPATL